MAEDVGLLLRWRNGDAKAGEAFIRSYYPAVYKQIRAQTGGDADLAADLTQSVFEVVLNKHDDSIENIGAYLRGIAHRKVLGHFRRWADKQADHQISQLVRSEIGAISRLAKAEDARLLVQALRSLSIEDQQYLVWTYAEGLSQQQVAERLGLKRSQVNGRIDRARGRLRRKLDKQAESSAQRASISMGFETWVRSLQRRSAS
ncbi:MAG: sigma-70 family RNA polymerase sigma factor [Myxococcota bacterium]